MGSGKGGACRANPSAGDVTIPHHEELEKISSPGYSSSPAREDVHKMNP